MQSETKTAHALANAPLNDNTQNALSRNGINILDVKISCFASATSTDKPRDVTVGGTLDAIRDGGNRTGPLIQRIREVYRKTLGCDNAKKQAVAAYKKKLPALTWCGRFLKRCNDGLIEYSGLICADLDKLGYKRPDVRAKLKKSPYVFALWASPTDGLKVLVRVLRDASQYSGSFRAVEKHILEITGIQIDQSAKDVARLCFMSWDPSLYVNENAVEIEALPEPERQERVSNGVVNLSERQRIAAEILGAVDWQSDTSGFVACPGKHLHTQGNGERDCMVQLDNVPTLYCFHDSCRGILEGVNKELRSRIGKAEYQPIVQSEQKNEATGRLDARNANPDPVIEPLRPYVSPPLDLLPASFQDYIRAAAESLNVDPAFILLPLLSSVGSAIGDSRSVLLKKNFVQPPVIWTGIIGRSGSRKSPALEAGCFALLQHERELVRQNKTEMEMFQEQMAEWEAKDRKTRGVRPVELARRTCLLDNLTIETLADAVQANPRGVLVRKDELSQWFSSFDQYTNARGADVSQWLSFHTANYIGVDRRSDDRHYRIFNPRVCITGGIQPTVLKRLLTPDYFERGLPARILFAAPLIRQDKWSESEIGEELQNEVLELFERLWLLQPGTDENLHQHPKLLGLDADAKKAYADYYNECGASSFRADERGEAAWSKLSGYAARLALVGQLARDPDAVTVTGETMHAACNLARWFGNEALRIYATFSETREQREQRQLVEFIQSRDGIVSVRDLTHYCWSYKNRTEDAERALTALVKSGRGKWIDIKPDGRGRPTQKFQLFAASPSPKIPDPRGGTLNYGDGEVPNTMKTQLLPSTATSVRMAQQKGESGLSPGEFLALATPLFNATPAAQ